MDDKLKYWVWTAQAAGAGSGSVWRILEKFGYDPENVYNADNEEIIAAADTKHNNVNGYFNKSLDEAERIVEWCGSNFTEIITPESQYYPARLKEIRNPPVVMYCAGRLPRIDDLLCVACVGTRDATDYGKNISYTVSYDLAKSGSVIVSGLALGIDAACHRAALDAGGDTIAVLGCGINVCYPTKNKALMREIGRYGTVLTEYPPDSKPIAKHFPLRNRIICGMCQCTVVFEADYNSGSLITADLAVKEGRGIYAVPGNAGELNSLGTNALIKKGVPMITTARDILKDFEFLYPDRVHPEMIIPLETDKQKRLFLFSKPKTEKVSSEKQKKSNMKKKAGKDETDPALPNDLSEDEKNIFTRLSVSKPLTAEELFACGLPLPVIMSALTTLEISGLIEALPGGAYIRKI